VSRLVIWDALDRRPTALLQELAGSREVDFTWTRDASLFEVAAGSGEHAVALVLVRGVPTEAQAAVIHRVAAQLFTVALVPNVATESLRALLRLGVREVYAEPITPHRLFTALGARARGVWVPSPASAVLHPVDPVVCTLSVFGDPETSLPARWFAVAPGAFEVSTTGVVEVGALVEVLSAPPSVRSSAGLFGRVVRVDTLPGLPSRLRCEALPQGDHPPLSLDSQSGSEPREVKLPPPAPLRFDPAILAGLVAVLLVAAGLAWMALAREAPAPTQDAATTREVLDGIQRAFE
jgi:hypothetical protein